ncbi:MAG: Thiamine pyrophosphate-requiring protein PA2108, partial [uncultured Solirubrobacteraceae bacterium]
EPERRRPPDRAPHRQRRAPHLWLPGRRDQRDHGRPEPRRRRHRRRRAAGVRAGPSRGDGGLHGVRAREVLRRGRSLPGDVGARCDPPAQRPLRRQARSPAGGGDRRPAGAQRAGRQLPAGGRPRLAVQGRRPRVRAHGDRPDADPPPRRSRRADRARRAHRHLPDRAQRPAGAGRGGAGAPGARDGPLGRRLQRVLAAAERRRAAPGGGGARRGPARRDPRRRGGAGRDRRGHRDRRAARRGHREGAARQGRGARRRAVRHRLDRPAGHEAQLGPDGGLRHPADGRLELSVCGVPARGGPGARGADRHRRADDRHPLPDGGQPRRRQRADAARADRAGEAQDRPHVARDRRDRRRGLVEGARGAGDERRRPDQPAARLLGAELAPARELHPVGRLRLGRELVRPRPEAAARHEGVGIGHAGVDGLRRSVRDRREVRPSRSRRDRVGRRRRDADERHQRAHHDRQVLAALERPAPDRPGAQQPRPQPGHLGAARDGGRPEVRRLPEPARLPLRALCRTGGPARDPRRAARGRGGGVGRRAGGRSSRRAGCPDRPRDRGAAAAHHLRAGTVAGRRAARRRPGRPADHQAQPAREDARAPAAPLL